MRFMCSIGLLLQLFRCMTCILLACLTLSESEFYTFNNMINNV